MNMHDTLDEIWWSMYEQGMRDETLEMLDRTIHLYWNPGNQDGSLDYLFLAEIGTYK